MFASFDELLIERVFQPVCNLLADRFGVKRASAAGFCLDIASLGWILARAPQLSRETMAWDAVPATLHLVILLVGLMAFTGLRSVFRRRTGSRQANPLRLTMRPHRAVVLVMFLARLMQFQAMDIATCADAVMLVAAAVALYLGACGERPPLHRSALVPQPSLS